MISFLKTTYRSFKKKIRFFFSVNWIKTIYFNYKMLPYKQASKLPVYFYGSVKFTNLMGELIIDAPLKRAMIGFGQQYEKNTRSRGIAELVIAGKLCFKGHVQFGKDYFIFIKNKAYCEFGHLASMASFGKIICHEEIIFGTYARIGSEAQVMDTNFHQMMNTKTGEKYEMTAPIKLGNYNYFGSRVSIMQKTVTPDYCTIASNSLCNKDYSDLGENIMIGGIPATLLKTDISRDWEGEKEMLERSLIV